MRYDMSGGAAVLGAMRAIAQLRPSIPVTALIPAVENMPGARRSVPVTSSHRSPAKQWKCLNTDAEGRLILIDALTYAQRLGCTHLVDAATLTGAIVIALGTVNIGAFTNKRSSSCEKLLRRLQSRRRENLADAHGRGVQGAAEERLRRSA